MSRNIAFDLIEALTGKRLEYFKRGKNRSFTKKGPGRHNYPNSPKTKETKA